jgi:hypothetical protein
MARLHGAVAEEDNGHGVETAQACGQRAPERDRHVPSDDAGRAHEAVLDVDEVHRAAEPAAETRVASHELRHHAPEARPLCDRVPVGPVPGVDVIVVAELRADGRGHALLPGREVNEPVDLAGADELADTLLEEADPPHGGEQADRLLAPELVH